MRVLFTSGTRDVSMWSSCLPWCSDLVCLHTKIPASFWAVWASRVSAKCELCKLLRRQGFLSIQTWSGWGFFLLFLLVCFVHKWSPSYHWFSIHNLISCVLLLVVNTEQEIRFELLHMGNVPAVCSTSLGLCTHATGLRRRQVEVKLL